MIYSYNLDFKYTKIGFSQAQIPCPNHAQLSEHLANATTPNATANSGALSGSTTSTEFLRERKTPSGAKVIQENLETDSITEARRLRDIKNIEVDLLFQRAKGGPRPPTTQHGKALTHLREQLQYLTDNPQELREQDG